MSRRRERLKRQLDEMVRAVSWCILWVLLYVLCYALFYQTDASGNPTEPPFPTEWLP